MYKDIKVQEFFEELSSKNGVPGGGGATGIVIANASSLTLMVLNIVSSRKKFQEINIETKFKIENSIRIATKIRDKALEFIDEDARNFDELIFAIKNKEKDTEEKYLNALNLPLSFMGETLNLYEALEVAKKYAGEFLISDVEIAMDFLHSAIIALGKNVTINITGVKNKENIINELKSLLKSNTIKYNNLKEI